MSAGPRELPTSGNRATVLIAVSVDQRDFAAASCNYEVVRLEGVMVVVVVMGWLMARYVVTLWHAYG